MVGLAAEATDFCLVARVRWTRGSQGLFLMDNGDVLSEIRQVKTAGNVLNSVTASSPEFNCY
jgi:hypothetical protein